MPMQQTKAFERFGKSAGTTYLRLIKKGCNPAYASAVAKKQIEMLGKGYEGGLSCVRYRRAYPVEHGGDGLMTFTYSGPSYNLTKWQYQAMVKAYQVNELYLIYPDPIPLEERRLARAAHRLVKTAVAAGLLTPTKPDLLPEESEKYYTFGPLGRDIMKLWQDMGYTDRSLRMNILPPQSFGGQS